MLQDRLFVRPGEDDGSVRVQIGFDVHVDVGVSIDFGVGIGELVERSVKKCNETTPSLAL